MSGYDQRERVWPPAALELLDRLVLANTYVGAIRGRLRPALGWYPTEHEVRWQAERWNRRAPVETRVTKAAPVAPRPKLGPGGFTMLGGRTR